MIFRRIGRVFRRVVNVGKKVFQAVSKPISSFTKKFIGPVTKILEKIPGGKFIAGFASKFLSNPLSLLSKVGLGPIGVAIAALGTSGSLADIIGILTKSGGAQNPQGANNLLNMAAAQHARIYRA